MQHFEIFFLIPAPAILQGYSVSRLFACHPELLCHTLPCDLAWAAPESELGCLLKRASHSPQPAKQQDSGDLSGKTITQVKETDILGGCLTILPTPGKESIKN